MVVLHNWGVWGPERIGKARADRQADDGVERWRVEAGEAEIAMVSLIQKSSKLKYSNMDACYSLITFNNGFYLNDDCPFLDRHCKFPWKTNKTKKQIQNKMNSCVKVMIKWLRDYTTINRSVILNKLLKLNSTNCHKVHNFIALVPSHSWQNVGPIQFCWLMCLAIFWCY